MIIGPDTEAGLTHELATQGWAVARNIIGPDEISSLHDFFQSERERFVPLLVSEPGGVVRNPEVRGDYGLRVSRNHTLPVFLAVNAFLSNLQVALNEKLNLGIQSYALDAAYFPPTYGFQLHRDVYSDPGQVLTFALYLNEDWEPRFGGELRLYDSSLALSATIPPEAGTFFIFRSADFPHEVRLCRRERRCLRGWYSTQSVS